MIPLYASVGLMAYLAFYVSYFLFDAWITNMGKYYPNLRGIAPYCIDGCWSNGDQDRFSTSTILLGNFVLMGMFAFQHSLMAREDFKRRWMHVIPPQIERSVYILGTSICLVMFAALWEPMPYVWIALPGALASLSMGLHYLGVAIFILSSIMLGHRYFFGLAQAFSDSSSTFETTPNENTEGIATERPAGESAATSSGSGEATTLTSPEKVPGPQQQLCTKGFYAYIRHPIIAGTLLALWAAPNYSTGRLLLNTVLTMYSLAATHFLEEPYLRKKFGDEYKVYMDTVPAFVPLLDLGAHAKRLTPPGKMETSALPAARESNVKG